ncbi:MAG: hypothetical protein QM737_21980 [Ferruginibacter sp.]
MQTLLTLLNITMRYSNIIYTKVLDQHKLKTMLHMIIEGLKKSNIDQVDLLFGWYWGKEYRNEIPVKTKVDDLITEINKPIDLNLGKLGSDDVSIIVTEMEMEFLFCHDGDIHFSFNQTNELAEYIISYWESESIIHTVKKLKGDNR